MAHEQGGGGGGDADTLRFLVTTDNHLGFMERDPRRGDDSYVTFEEALSVGRVEYDCDAVILGGDLFHDNKPSLSCITRTTRLFRKYVMGSKAVDLELLSDPATNFPTHPVPIANFQDPNMNIALPVFMIHGNHDDPINGVSAIDTLSTAGLVNYFGQTTDVDDIVVRPVLLQKGSTRVALYGLGNVRDERLNRCFSLGKVRFLKPREDARGWFSILVLHQNRGCRSAASKCGIDETSLLGFGFDLVIWGNEHEQRMTPTSVGNAMEIIQPGSTVMTSLSAAESNPKQCAVLEINGTAYRLAPHNLRSVRPVVRRSIELWREASVTKTADSVEAFLKKVGEDMLVEAEEKIKRIPDAVLRAHPPIKYPLMRLAVDFSDPQGTASFPQPNLQRLGQSFIDVVVNPSDMIKAAKPRASARAAALRSNDPNARDLDGILAPADDDGGEGDDGAGGPRQNVVSTDDIRTKIAQVFSANAKDACTLLSEPEVSHAVHSYVEKGERAAIEEVVDTLLQGCQKAIWKSVRDTPDDVTRVGISELAILNKKEKNRMYFERHDRLAAGGGGGGDEGLPPVPPPQQQQHDDNGGLPALGGRAGTAAGGGIGALATRSAAALSGIGLGGPDVDVIDVDGANDPAAVVAPAAGSGSGSGVQNIVAQHMQAAAAAPAAAPKAKKPAPKKRGRTAKADGADQTGRAQPSAPATGGGPQLQTTTTTTNSAAIVMSRWGAGPA